MKCQCRVDQRVCISQRPSTNKLLEKNQCGLKKHIQCCIPQIYHNVDSKDIGKIQVEDNNEYTVSNYASWLKEDTSYSNLFNATTMIRGLTANFNEKHIYKMIDDIRNLCHDPIKYKGKAVINMV
ncbi:hypothetical protein GJ496_004109 [Pomphorhynchus laevis]|nr:hypothetical protein GJ496_004109 [Pomphorhynchus laevis]